jgi:hypothetical protein
MKILLVETSPISKNNDVCVHARNSIILSEHLNQYHDCRLVSSEEEILDVEEQFDYIIYISATFYFKHLRFEELMNNQKNCKIGWITNEFELFANDFLKNRMDFIIANFEEWGVKAAHKHNKFLMTNLNALQARLPNLVIDKHHDVCYYGTYRKYREPYFRKYLTKDMVLSTSGKNIKKFQLLGCDCLLTDKFSWEKGQETLNLFHATLGIEDTKTHKLFNYLPNRWFESLYCNCAIFFDKTCQNSINKDVYNIDKWFIIDSYDELINKVNELKAGRSIEDHICFNTIIALREKDRTLLEIEEFLVNY